MAPDDTFFKLQTGRVHDSRTGNTLWGGGRVYRLTPAEDFKVRVAPVDALGFLRQHILTYARALIPFLKSKGVKKKDLSDLFLDSPMFGDEGKDTPLLQF